MPPRARWEGRDFHFDIAPYHTVGRKELGQLGFEWKFGRHAIEIEVSHANIYTYYHFSAKLY